MTDIHLYDFEHFNSTTTSIYELGEFDVLIILDTGVNLVSWDDVDNKDEVIYISEDLFGKNILDGRYKDLKNLKAIVTIGVGQVESMKELFSGCESLEEISTLSSWDVSNVKDINYMFEGCSSLKDISALSDWNVSNVENALNVFSGCSSLEDISPLENWNMSNARSISGMFSECTSLKDISPLSKWDVSNVRDAGRLFYFCTSLENVSALGNWKLNHVFNITALLHGCVSLKDISPLSKWDLSEMKRNKSLISVFSYCASLKDISSLKKWDISNITRLSGLFEGCIQLKNTSALENWDTTNVTSLDFMFRDCSGLTNVSHLKSWNIQNVDTTRGMFDSCISLSDIAPLGEWNVSGISSMNKMFYNCSSLSDVSALNSWKISEGCSFKSIFDECELIEDYPDWFKIELIKNSEGNQESMAKMISNLDESFFKTHNLNVFDENTQSMLVDSIDNQSLLAYIVDRSGFKSVQNQALDKITDEVILTNIAINDHSYDIYSNKGSSNLSFFFYNREKALLKIKNKVLLIKIAKELQDILDNMAYITKYIDTEEEWMDIVLNAKSFYIRLLAFDNIKAENSFKRIIDESDDDKLKLIASKKLIALSREKESEE